jgi:hypothetical protein
MSMTKSERLQVLIEPEQSKRLQLLARQRGVPVAVVVRQAIDVEIGRARKGRTAAADRILASEPIEVPADPAELEVEIAGELGAPDE